MSILDAVTRRAEAALVRLCERAQQERWDTTRIEHEKSLYQLKHEVTLCQAPGCLVMVKTIPGFLYARCDEHQQPEG